MGCAPQFAHTAQSNQLRTVALSAAVWLDVHRGMSPPTGSGARNLLFRKNFGKRPKPAAGVNRVTAVASRQPTTAQGLNAAPKFFVNSGRRFKWEGIRCFCFNRLRARLLERLRAAIWLAFLKKLTPELGALVCRLPGLFERDAPLTDVLHFARMLARWHFELTDALSERGNDFVCLRELVSQCVLAHKFHAKVVSVLRRKSPPRFVRAIEPEMRIILHDLIKCAARSCGLDSSSRILRLSIRNNRGGFPSLNLEYAGAWTDDCDLLARPSAGIENYLQPTRHIVTLTFLVRA